jgi:Flp pilus assembly protein TadG
MASDSDTPAQTLTFSLTSSPTNSTLDPTSGVFAWRPNVNQANSTNPISVVVTDNGAPNMSTTQSFSVTVNSLTAPSISQSALNAGSFTLSVGGQAGPDYAVETSTNLFNWTISFVTNSPAMPFIWSGSASNPVQFYRIKTGPPLP